MTLMQGKEDGIPGPLLHQLIGSGAYDRQGKGNINAGDGGVAFIVASAESIPGSPKLVHSCPCQRHPAAVAVLELC